MSINWKLEGRPQVFQFTYGLMKKMREDLDARRRGAPARIR